MTVDQEVSSSETSRTAQLPGCTWVTIFPSPLGQVWLNRYGKASSLTTPKPGMLTVSWDSLVLPKPLRQVSPPVRHRRHDPRWGIAHSQRRHRRNLRSETGRFPQSRLPLSRQLSGRPWVIGPCSSGRSLSAERKASVSICAGLIAISENGPEHLLKNKLAQFTPNVWKLLKELP